MTRGKPKVDKETLQRFADNGKHLYEAAHYFGVPESSMPYWCRKYGVTFRRKNAAAAPREKAARITQDAPPAPAPGISKDAPLVAPKQPAEDIPDSLAALYEKVVEVRFHMRRLANREKTLLLAISEKLDKKKGADRC